MVSACGEGKQLLLGEVACQYFDMLQNQLEILMFYFDFTMWPVLAILGLVDFEIPHFLAFEI